MADRTSLSEDEGTLTRSEVRKERGQCRRCGAPLTDTGGFRRLYGDDPICSYLLEHGYHRDRAE